MIYLRKTQQKCPRAPKLEDNSFADFATSPSRKKKRETNKSLTYVVVKFIDDNKTMKYFSCFAIQRALHLISKEIISISELRDCSLLLLVKTTNRKKISNTKTTSGFM